MRQLERNVLLNVIDRKWREHLYEMDYLKEGIGLRAMAQRDPLVEYQREGYDMFIGMLDGAEGGVGRLPVQRPGRGRAAARRRVAPVAAPQGLADLGAPRTRSPADASSRDGLRAKGIDDEESRPADLQSARRRTARPRCSATGRPARGPRRAARRKERREAREAARQGARSRCAAAEAANQLRAQSPEVQGDHLPAHPGGGRHLLDAAGDRVHALARGCSWRPPRQPLPSAPTRLDPHPPQPGGAAAGRAPGAAGSSESTSPAASSGRSWASGPAPVDHLEHPPQRGVGERRPRPAVRAARPASGAGRARRGAGARRRVRRTGPRCVAACGGS